MIFDILINIIKTLFSPIFFILDKLKIFLVYINKNLEIERNNKIKKEKFKLYQKRLHTLNDRII